MTGWGITNLQRPSITARGNKLEAQVERDGRLNPDQPIYWVAPLKYLENKVRK